MTELTSQATSGKFFPMLAKPFDVDTVNRLVVEVVARSLDEEMASPVQRG